MLYSLFNYVEQNEGFLHLSFVGVKTKINENLRIKMSILLDQESFEDLSIFFY
jgi:hypothetical protein